MAVDVKIVMNPTFYREIDKRCNIITKAIAADLRDEIKSKLSVPYPPASKPGSPPHKRSGATKRSIVIRSLGKGDWAVAMKKQLPGKENLGIWLELGTGAYREPFPIDSKGSITGEYATPGRGITSMRSRPFMLNTLLSRGHVLARKNLRKHGMRTGLASKIGSVFGF